MHLGGVLAQVTISDETVVGFVRGVSRLGTALQEKQRMHF